MQEQVGPVFSTGNVLGKTSAERPADGKLLGHNERFEHHLDGNIHVIVADIVTEVHLGVGRGHAQDALDVSDGDGDSPRIGRFFSEGDVESGNLFLVKGTPLEGGSDVRSGILNVLFQEVLVDDPFLLVRGARRKSGLPIAEVPRRNRRHVTGGHKLGQPFVENRINSVLEDAQNIKAL